MAPTKKNSERSEKKKPIKADKPNPTKKKNPGIKTYELKEGNIKSMVAEGLSWINTDRERLVDIKICSSESLSILIVASK